MYNTPRAATIIATSPGAIWGLVSEILVLRYYLQFNINCTGILYQHKKKSIILESLILILKILRTPNTKLSLCRICRSKPEA